MKKPKKNKSKWSRIFGDATFGFWNPWSYSNKRHEYVKSLRYDVLGLGELHNKQLEDHYKEKRWICSERSIIEQGVDTDPAAGVAILLSPRMADRILDKGNVGARIVYVRLQGPVCNLFIVVIYVPHKGRKRAPYAKDILQELDALLRTVHKTDCIVVMGDLNCELQRNVENCTGQWCMTQIKDNGHGEEMLNVMRSHDLFAVDTLFKPARKTWGHNKKLRYCNATYMAKHTAKRPRKLDYILVSNRWKGMVKNVRTTWRHRSIVSARDMTMV